MFLMAVIIIIAYILTWVPNSGGKHQLHNGTKWHLYLVGAGAVGVVIKTGVLITLGHVLTVVLWVNL